MNPLHLTGYGVKVKVNSLKSNSELFVTDGRDDYKNAPSSYMFKPRRISYDSIIIDGHSGYISLQAFHWLSRNNIPVFILNFEGSLITSILPPTPIKADIRAAQMQAATDDVRRFHVAYALVQAKIRRSLDVMKWIEDRYDISEKTRQLKSETLSLFNAKSVNDIRTVEGRVALRYW